MRITNATLTNRPHQWDIDTTGTTITTITPATGQPGDFDARGKLLTTQFVEAHIHLDYANTAGIPKENTSGTLFEAIDIWKQRKEQGLHTYDTVRTNALTAARQLAHHGVGAVRTHVDVTDPSLTSLTALLEVKDTLKEIIDIQIVAFPQNGMYAYPGGDALVEKALDMGADVIGAIPHLEPTREAGLVSLDHAFTLAEQRGLMVDVHCDEIDDEHSRFVDSMVAHATQRSMGDRTVVSHAVAMAYYSPGYMSRLLPKIADSHIRFAVCPNENLHLQGRGFTQATPRGVAPIKQLTDFDIPVSLCQDSMSDPWYPMGAGDPLRILDSGLHVGHMLAHPYLDNALDFITTHPAGNLGIDTGITEGAPANLLVIDAANAQDAVRLKSDILLSVHRGKEVFRRTPAVTTWANTTLVG